MKSCLRCKIEKKLDDFYSDIRNKDKKDNYCIECKKKMSLNRYRQGKKENRDYFKAERWDQNFIYF